MSKASNKEVSGETMNEPVANADKLKGKKQKEDRIDEDTGSKPTGAGGAAGPKQEGPAGDEEADAKASGKAKAYKDSKAPKDTGDSDKTSDGSEVDPAAALSDELTAERDKYLRLAAEYDNYRKRSTKEREMMYGDARADTITRLLPVYDNLERALKMDCSDEPFYKGVEMTMTQLTEILENMGVKQIPAAGEPFDPNLHDAVITIENPELGEKIIAEECRKGFMLGDRVIRHSTVVVAN